jgi:hypothetical protein
MHAYMHTWPQLTRSGWNDPLSAQNMIVAFNPSASAPKIMVRHGFSPFATRRYVFVRFSSKAVAEKVAGHLQYNHKCRWPPSQRSCRNKHTRDRCYDFLNIFAEKFSEKMVCLTQNKAKLCKILIITLVFEKNAGNAGNPGGMMHSQHSSMWQLAKHFCSSKKSFIQTSIDVYVHKHFYGPIGLFTRKNDFSVYCTKIGLYDAIRKASNLGRFM